MSKVCSDCQFSIQYFPDLFCTVRKLSTKDGLFVDCHHYLPKTVFDRIMESPKVLAEEFVEPYTRWGEDGYLETLWRSNFRELSGMLFDTKAEALAATVARLNEVAK